MRMTENDAPPGKNPAGRGSRRKWLIVTALVLAAVNDALKKSQEMVSAEMSKLTGGLNIPGL